MQVRIISQKANLAAQDISNAEPMGFDRTDNIVRPHLHTCIAWLRADRQTKMHMEYGVFAEHRAANRPTEQNKGENLALSSALPRGVMPVRKLSGGYYLNYGNYSVHLTLAVRKILVGGVKG